MQAVASLVVQLNGFLWTKDQIADRLAYIMQEAEAELEEGRLVSPGYYTEQRIAEILEDYAVTLSHVCVLLGFSLEQTARVIGEHGQAVICGVEPGEPLFIQKHLAKHEGRVTSAQAQFEAHRASKARDDDSRPGLKPAFAV